ncbi:hydroxyethylthiazole kinase [Leuconostoc gasicomitatum]|uniref:hydroxyethylthiazole kinase n=1 Tax=Leuconostoc gasicomitatum TaxID=115778 RepID=UPI000BD43856|nr:hydroxyethylthiazole kinase [Leuconostoc gasicomitatum]MBZ5944310.1 hydroxyethylthiazole kinase [Leuconostoc gasicomitatum]MBZ5950482.1 hydroxyethylthiazole kinase [Leuconostoc gasicomitatum]MBZ5950804.1 hydroxyethylthiazole kinase [Leuconostoc gasicomitatum]MBZ5967702.1 hydroxyethylthiazole kinase [Leuconostoc gasicomitatum]MBZ5972347.1 hydroxyethylthiazole kinase [Leuconostoc gasicomitatum]
MKLSEIKDKKPLVFNYANYVTPQFVANVVNVIGGSSIMARELEEFPDLVAASDAVVINSGTWRRSELLETIKLAQLANQAGKVVVLDPVAVGIPSRSLPVVALMADAQIDIIRGNAAEIAWFAGVDFSSQGIDATGNGDVRKIALLAAEKTGAIIALSGKQDVISDGHTTLTIDVDVPLLATNVGTGDALSALIGTYNGDGISIKNTMRAMATMKLAGIKASKKVKTPGYFVNQLLDELYLLSENELDAFINGGGIHDQ